MIKENICIFGFKDSSVGYINFWIEDLTRYNIECFISVVKIKKIKEKFQNKATNQKILRVKNKIFNKKIFFTINYISLLKKKKIKKCLILEDDPLLRHQIYTKLKKIILD